MTDAVRAFEEDYAGALEAYLGGAGEPALHRAYELGRSALADGLGPLDIAAVHYKALARVFPDTPAAEERPRTIRMLESFLVETLSPFEMAYRGAREANTALRRLNERLEEEARRLARALHDEAGQLLAAVYLSVADLAPELMPAGRERLGEIYRLLDQIDEQLRHIAHELRPAILDDLGLLPALEFLVEGVSKRTGLPISVEASTGERMPPALEVAVYRIVQEALTNVTKHAQAASVKIELQRSPDRISCSVRDDGVGFDVSATSATKRGLGLVGIRERLDAVGGRLEITSAPRQGTAVTIIIPLER